MSFTKTVTLASACLLVSLAIASADEVRLTDETLDTVTAGAIQPLPPISPLEPNIGGLTGAPTLFGPLNPEPPPPPPPPPPSEPPSFPGGGALSNLQQLLQQLFAFAGGI
jgi:hypothetical protein